MFCNFCNWIPCFVYSNTCFVYSNTFTKTFTHPFTNTFTNEHLYEHFHEHLPALECRERHMALTASSSWYHHPQVLGYHHPRVPSPRCILYIYILWCFVTFVIVVYFWIFVYFGIFNFCIYGLVINPKAIAKVLGYILLNLYEHLSEHLSALRQGAAQTRIYAALELQRCCSSVAWWTWHDNIIYI